MENGIMLDTETTNSLDDPLFYDVGWQVINTDGKIFTERSFVNADVFLNEKELMKIAFYADKIPQYWEEIKNGSRVLASTYAIAKQLSEDVKMYNCSFICAHNARFDYRALATTQRYITKSKYRYFVPYGIEWWDTLKMARQVLGKNVDYKQFCDNYGYTCKNGTPRLTAEIIFRYLTNNTEFVEAHTGLADVDIERQILVYCLQTMPEVERKLWNN